MSDNTIYLIGQFANTISEIVLFSSIPFLWYIISKKKFKGAFKYLGLKKTNKQNYFQALKITSLAYIFSFSVIVIIKLIQGDVSLNPLESAYNSRIIIFIISLILFGMKAAISEEILFRGFLGKRLIYKFGFLKGNILQSIIFMMVHIFSFSKLPTLEAILFLINSAIIGFVFGYIMDKKCDGSILPAMICHGAVNITTAIIVNII
ncbi:CPBP family intramembrane metalloprotease [Paraclostridium ghonii]|uniref:Membrane protease YdiL (CAAX protease family) n=1 Tax=Paraclostridium ghonii TaxID=29358 RepID=A0ABU0MYH8_9FIRM|nr:type II CAAX endopeptidase family protein [Paeniclostridium ghonii]MDQ0555911.1 membrane protease YdiL (CAAX protease family) [Paeniclostridium ghonii]